MLKRSIVGVRELNRLKSTSGTGGWYRGVDKIPWCFDNVTSVGREALITPSNPSSLVIQAVTDPCSNECNVPVPDDDSDSGTTSSEETNDSYLSDDSNVSDTPHQGGNRIINLPNLLLSLNDIVTCKHCCVSDLDDFVHFCELKLKNKEKGQCKCGSTSHSRTSHTDCPLNKKQKLNKTGNSDNEMQDIVNLP
jgi:hypothetical protein